MRSGCFLDLVSLFEEDDEELGRATECGFLYTPGEEEDDELSSEEFDRVYFVNLPTARLGESHWLLLLLLLVDLIVLEDEEEVEVDAGRSSSSSRSISTIALFGAREAGLA